MSGRCRHCGCENPLAADKAIASAARTARRARRWTLEALAAQLGVQPSAISYWERGLRAPSPENKARWLKALGLQNDERRAA